MNESALRKLLEQVRDGEISLDRAFESLRSFPYDDLPYARVDTQRELRCGFPEVIFCAGKRPEHIEAIARSILKGSDVLLATRADRAAFEAIRAASPDAEYHELARCVTVRRQTQEADGARARANILIVCAGTSDAPVAERARVTAEILGQ